MGSLQTSLSQLRHGFSDFSNPVDFAQSLNKPFAQIPNINNCHIHLQKLLSVIVAVDLSTMSATMKASCQSIEHKCKKLSRQLSDKNGVVLPEVLKRVNALSTKIQTLQQLVDSDEHVKSTAEAIYPFLKDSDLRKEIRRNTLSRDASDLFKNVYSKSLTATRLFLERVHDEQYGTKAKAAILDSSEQHLVARESFLRLLLLDLLFESENKNPQEATEWFSAMSEEHVAKLQKAFSTDLNQEKILLGKKKVSEEAEKLISEQVAHAYLPVEKFALVMEYMRLYFAPTKEEITAVIDSLSQRDPKKAFDLAVALSTACDHTNVLALLKAIHEKSPEKAFELINSLSSTHEALYAHCQSTFVPLTLPVASTLVNIQQALDALSGICESPYYVDGLKALIVKTCDQDMADDRLAFLEKIIRLPKEFVDRASCLDCLIEQMIPRTLSIAELHAPVETMRSFLERLKEETMLFEYGLSTLAQYYIYANAEPRVLEKFISLFKMLQLPKTRKASLEHLANHLCTKFKAEDAASAICTFLPSLVNPNEQSKFLEHCSLYIAFQDAKIATELAQKISEPVLRAHCVKQLERRTQIDNRSAPNISVRVHIMGSNDVPADLMNRMLQSLSNL